MTTELSSPNGKRANPSCKVAVYSGPRDYSSREAVAALVDRAIAAVSLPPDFVRPGDRVVLKPNWVKEHDERYPAGPGRWEQMITHPHVIEAVVRWAAERLEGHGSITVCDGPQSDSSFTMLSRYCGLDEVAERCRRQFPGVDIAFRDLRPEQWHSKNGVTVSKTPLSGDPRGNTLVRLDGASEFAQYQGQGRLYGASYDVAETNAHHNGNRHDYLLCRTPMDADVFINLPKLKTHKKVGLTCALKNLVGINVTKNWLPHYTKGTPDLGGDQFPASTVKTRLEQAWMGMFKRWLNERPRLSRVFVPVKTAGEWVFGDTQQVIRSGNWHGNDTCWRMVLDLNKCLLHFDGAGAPRTRPLRYLAVVDGVVAGEGNGPLAADPKPCGVVLAGTHPVAVDMVAGTLMGFDWTKLRMLRNSFEDRELRLCDFRADDIEVLSDNAAWRGGVADMKDTFAFRPHFGWTGAIEMKPLQPVG